MDEANAPEPPTPAVAAPAKPSSLDGFMKRALDEGEYAIGRMTVAGIKKTRTSLRRARSVAEVFETFDPDPTWKIMRQDARALFREIGPLRDLHVMREWIQALSDDDDEVGVAYQRLLAYNERKQRVRVREALAAFDWQQWDGWRQHLGRRAAAVDRGHPVILHAAYERWETVEALHRQCMSGAPAWVWHELRKAVKRFRYTLEIFAPKRYRAIRSSVKKVQDALGELNDLDVLHDELMAIMPLFTTASRRHWTSRLRAERQARIARYHALVGEEPGPPYTWLTILPQGDEVLQGALARWQRRFADDNTAALGNAAAALHHALGSEDLEEERRERPLLLAAAALFAVPGTPKSAARRIRTLAPTPPLSAADLEAVALIVRYARAGWPQAGGRRLAKLPRRVQERVLRLATLLGAVAALQAHAPDRVAALAADGEVTDDDRATLLALVPAFADGLSPSAMDGDA
jgi:CHAD domain-containing protein